MHQKQVNRLWHPDNPVRAWSGKKNHLLGPVISYDMHLYIYIPYIDARVTASMANIKTPVLRSLHPTKQETCLSRNVIHKKSTSTKPSRTLQPIHPWYYTEYHSIFIIYQYIIVSWIPGPNRSFKTGQGCWTINIQYIRHRWSTHNRSQAADGCYGGSATWDPWARTQYIMSQLNGINTWPCLKIWNLKIPCVKLATRQHSGLFWGYPKVQDKLTNSWNDKMLLSGVGPKNWVEPWGINRVLCQKTREST